MLEIHNDAVEPLKGMGTALRITAQETDGSHKPNP